MNLPSEQPRKSSELLILLFWAERPRPRTGFSRLRFGRGPVGPGDSGVSGEGPGLPGPQTHELRGAGAGGPRSPRDPRAPLPPQGEQCLVPGPRPRGLLQGSGSPCRVLLLLIVSAAGLLLTVSLSPSPPAGFSAPSWRSCTTGSASAAPSTAPPTPASRPSTPTKYWPRASCPPPPAATQRPLPSRARPSRWGSGCSQVAGLGSPALPGQAPGQPRRPALKGHGAACSAPICGGEPCGLRSTGLAPGPTEDRRPQGSWVATLWSLQSAQAGVPGTECRQ